MINKEIKPCPFCGSSASVGIRNGFYKVICNNTECSTDTTAGSARTEQSRNGTQDERGKRMTNREKFKEVYGFELDGNPCAAPQSICNEQTCERCPFWGWWDKEYKACFRYEEKKEEKTMTRTEAELAIVEKIREIKDIALGYDKDIKSLSMWITHYDGTDDYFDDEWVINLHSDNHSLDVFVQGGEVCSTRVHNRSEIIAEGVEI